tara:strand:- start:674 stop:931 length:258 start_codon:yes stop_codon:yes gene_type:complete
MGRFVRRLFGFDEYDCSGYDFVSPELLRMAMGEEQQGSIVALTQCSCSGCSNSFFVRASSTEFLPSICCYCGMLFDGHKTRVKED